MYLPTRLKCCWLGLGSYQRRADVQKALFLFEDEIRAIGVSSKQYIRSYATFVSRIQAVVEVVLQSSLVAQGAQPSHQCWYDHHANPATANGAASLARLCNPAMIRMTGINLVCRSNTKSPSFTRGKGRSGTGTPRKSHSGFQPSLGWNVSNLSGGTTIRMCSLCCR